MAGNVGGAEVTAQHERTNAAAGRLARWAVPLTEMADTDAKREVGREHFTLSLLIRAEMSALIGLLVAKGVFTAEEWLAALEREADLLNREYEQRFPGLAP